MKLIDYTKILRSKNAGPLYITFDLMFDDSEKFEYVKNNLHIKDKKRILYIHIQRMYFST